MPSKMCWGLFLVTSWAREENPLFGLHCDLNTYKQTSNMVLIKLNPVSKLLSQGCFVTYFMARLYWE